MIDEEDERFVNLITTSKGFATTIFFPNLYKDVLFVEERLMTLTK